MSQQCPACHVALTPTPGSYVLRCRRCGRRYAATPPSTKHTRRPPPDAGDGVNAFGFNFGPDIGGTPDFSSHDSGASDSGTSDSGHDHDFGGGGAFDGGGSSADF